MARTPIAYTDLHANGQLADPPGVTLDSGNGHAIPRATPELTLLRITNTGGTTATITVKAGEPSFALAAGLGDLSVTVPAGESVWAGPFDSGRFARRGDGLALDVAAGAQGRVTAFRIPRHT